MSKENLQDRTLPNANKKVEDLCIGMIAVLRLDDKMVITKEKMIAVSKVATLDIVNSEKTVELFFYIADNLKISEPYRLIDVVQVLKDIKEKKIE